jgi:alcohol dehydrogenase
MNAPLALNMHALMCAQVSLIGSLWFTVAEGEDMAAMIAAGTLDLLGSRSSPFPAGSGERGTCSR